VRLPFPPRGETREPARAAEPQPAESEAAPHDPIFDRLRMAHMAARRTGSEPPMVEGGEASLSPNGPPRAPVPPPVPEPAIEPRGFRPPDLRAPKSDERSRGGAEPARGPAPSAPAAAFEDAWPAPSRPSRGPAAEPASRELPAPRSNGSARHEEQIHQSAIAVLKSGIVDGMAYTLYTDGSIEAELAQGVVRFGSIEELRNHLEKGG
jgi:hypothetical protein